MRENPNVEAIDLGDNPISDKEMQKFYDQNLQRATAL